MDLVEKFKAILEKQTEKDPRLAYLAATQDEWEKYQAVVKPARKIYDTAVKDVRDAYVKAIYAMPRKKK